MKKILALCMTAFVLFTTALPCSAKNGDVIGQALYTDIVATINGYPIESFNVNGYTYIVAEDLEHYGFSVIWDGENRHLHVYKDGNDCYVSSYYEPTYIPSYMIGVPAHHILETDIITYLDNSYITSYNINGRTIIPFDALSWYGYVDWYSDEREIAAYLDWVDDGYAHESDAWIIGYDDGSYAGYQTGWQDGIHGYEYGWGYNDYCDDTYLDSSLDFATYEEAYCHGYREGYEIGYGEGLMNFDWEDYFEN